MLAFLQFVAQHGQRVVQALVYVNLLNGSLIHVRVLLYRRDQFGHAARAAFDLIHQSAHFQQRFQPGEHVAQHFAVYRFHNLVQRGFVQSVRRPAGHMAALDDVDRRIVEALRADGRRSMRALAGRLNVSRASAYARVARAWSGKA